MVRSDMEPAETSRLDEQIEFLLTADRLKTVIRASSIGDGTRRENSAEHSWHVALMALVLAEYSPEPLDLGRLLSILIVHDLVEIYAGDAAIYDENAIRGQAEREQEAARRLFSQLPDDQAISLAALWEEFEEISTPESRFARAVDALAPTWLHWGPHANPAPAALTATQILNRKSQALAGYPTLLEYLHRITTSAIARGLIGP